MFIWVNTVAPLLSCTSCALYEPTCARHRAGQMTCAKALLTRRWVRCDWNSCILDVHARGQAQFRVWLCDLRLQYAFISRRQTIIVQTDSIPRSCGAHKRDGTTKARTQNTAKTSTKGTTSNACSITGHRGGKGVSIP